MKGFVFGAVALAAPAFAQDAVVPATCTAQAAAVSDIIHTWQEAYNAGDAAKVAGLYAEGATYLTQHYVTGIVAGRAAIQAYVQLGIGAHYHIDSIRLLRVDCAGDVAYAIDRYDANNAGQKAFGVNLVVVRKLAGGWKIVAHEAAVPDPVTAVQSLDVK